MNRIFTLLLIAIFPLLLSSQSESLSKIYISKSLDGDFLIEYPVTKGETAYSISRKFKQPILAISGVNEDKDLGNLSQNEILKIPFSKDILVDPKESSENAIVYLTQPKETLYTIGKKYFDIEINKIKSLNNLKDYHLDVGQELIIGYIENSDKTYIIPKPEAPISSTVVVDNEEIVSEDDRPILIESPTVEQENDNAKIISRSAEDFSIADLIEMIDDESELGYDDEGKVEKEVPEEIIYSEEKGLAYTENVSMEGNELFILHPDAQVGTEMIITYPLTKRTVKAKVISELPKDLYPENISIVISPTVAEALGAKDDQFRVEMKYIRN